MTNTCHVDQVGSILGRCLAVKSTGLWSFESPDECLTKSVNPYATTMPKRSSFLRWSLLLEEGLEDIDIDQASRYRELDVQLPPSSVNHGYRKCNAG